MRRATITTSLLLFATGAHSGAAPADPVEFRGPPGSVTPNLAVGRDGRVLLTWLEPIAEGRHALRLAVRQGGRWTPPQTIRESDRFFVNWADFASLVETVDGQWVVHWLEKTEAKPYAYHVMLSVSADRGQTWSAPFPAHRDRSPTEHGFVAMLPRPSGGVDLAWLDGRRMDGNPAGTMGVRTTSLVVAGSPRLGDEVELDDRTCECCQVALARTSRGLVAAFRDRSSSEIRDIALAREVSGAWTEPQVIAADDWEHRACPVNGPALAADGDHLALVWFTRARNEPRVYLVQSDDGGATFGSRVRIDDGQTLGRVDAEPLGGGAVAIASLEGKGEADAEWRVRRVEADGRTGPARVVATVTRARLAGFPRFARAGADLLLSYTAPGADGGVRVIRLDPTRLATR